MVPARSSTSIENDARFGFWFAITTSMRKGSPANTRGGGRRETTSFFNVISERIPDAMMKLSSQPSRR